MQPHGNKISHSSLPVEIMSLPSDTLKTAQALVSDGCLQDAINLIDETLQDYSNNISLLHFGAAIRLELGDHEQAMRMGALALTLSPGNPQLHLTLGMALEKLGRRKAAIENYKKALEAEPTLVNASIYLAEAYIKEKNYRQAIILLVNSMGRHPDHPVIHNQLAVAYNKLGNSLLTNLHSVLAKYYLGPEKVGGLVDHSCKDAYFLDGNLACQTAMEENRVFQTIAVTGRQLCYSAQPLPANAPENCVYVPFEEITTFFTTTRLRHPSLVVFHSGDAEQRDEGTRVAYRLHETRLYRHQLTKKLIDECLAIDPFPLAESEPMRVFIPASRLTIVMQYASLAIATALRNQGCEVLYMLEDNDMEGLEYLHILDSYRNFKPHVVFWVNHLINSWQHPNVINISWWQDAMPEITSGHPLPWRKRDIILSTEQNIDNALRKVGAKQIIRQHFGFNEEIFQSWTPVEKRDKVVFVGSSYSRTLEELPESIVHEIEMIKGYCFDEIIDIKKELDKVLQFYGLHNIKHLNLQHSILAYLVRDSFIEEFCASADKIDLEIEIYGLWWEKNKIVKPFYKGSLVHGREIAKAYNQAKYAIAIHPSVLNSQRLAELSACGCIPLVFDTRETVEKPHWENECIFFKNTDEVLDAINRRLEKDPSPISEFYSYSRIVNNLMENIKEKMNTSPWT